MDLAELTRTAALLLVAIVGTGRLGDGFTIGDFRLLEGNGQLIVVFNSPFERAQVKLALTLYQGLLEFAALFNHPRGVFLMHSGQNLHEFFGVALGNGTDCTRIFGFGIANEVISPVTALLIERIAGAHVLEFDRSADIACTELVDLGADLAAHGINLGNSLLAVARHIVEVGAGFERAAHNLEVADFTDMRLNRRFEHIETQRAVALRLDNGAVGSLGRGHLLDKGNHIAEELHHAAHAHILGGADTENRINRTVNEALADAFAHFVFGKVACVEEFLHQRLVVFGSGLDQRLVEFGGALHLLGGNF